VTRRPLRVAAFTAGLVADGLFLDHRHGLLEQAGISSPVHAVIVAFLVAACLLGSVHAGLLLAMLLSTLPWLIRGMPAHRSPGELLALWTVVTATAAAASVHQREAQRRRRDAEALQGLATALHHDTDLRAVAVRVLTFGVRHLRAPRGVVVTEHGDSREVVAAHGSPRVPPAAEVSGASPLLSLATLTGGPTVHLRADLRRERWLEAVLPGAVRLLVTRLDVGLQERTWLLLDLRGRRGSPVERHAVTLLGQVGAMSALALDRVKLLAEATVRASHDPLTGVPNRRTLDELLDRLTARHRRTGDGFAVIMIDVDRFKSINDTVGHAAGDEVLRQVAATLLGQLRTDETVARYGGEEFAVVLPGADTTAGAAAAERLRVALHRIDQPVGVTASFGVASVPGDARTGGAVIALADAALLRAKHEGRDRVAVSVAPEVTSAGRHSRGG
jgi:diguanylate cyclase (GGDEF)-like protein